MARRGRPPETLGSSRARARNRPSAYSSQAGAARPTRKDGRAIAECNACEGHRREARRSLDDEWLNQALEASALEGSAEPLRGTEHSWTRRRRHHRAEANRACNSSLPGPNAPSAPESFTRQPARNTENSAPPVSDSCTG